ncbi:MAG: biotin--[acetyl-CoA-carboxylase] ligase [Actinomycetota bacterium]|nr:biotin--[acetyl-CoA-carboxylase] ligase [Actinomycetota bacterium]
MASPYSDLDRPPLPVRALRRALVRAGSPWSQLHVVAQTGSTNADLADLAAGGAPAGQVLVAELQTAGRGRLDRSWVAPLRSGLTFSVLLRPPVPRASWGWLPLLAGISVARAVEQVGEVPTALKWPNDVLAGAARAKVAGLLAEVRGNAVVLGFGLNVTAQRDELPRPGATSLALEGASCTDRATVLVAVLRALAEDYRDWLAGADVRDAYLQRCDTIGSSVRVALPGGQVLAGEAVDVDSAGRLVVVTPDGSRRAVAAGDVTQVRGQPRWGLPGW